ncbi:nucleotidyltransferase domain-containing protein [Bradyrhizobium sp. WYCCWR 13022]|uniref:nucleotidyltransferase family protein n=1 Tax=unclassified Bradyrhizobium TaxID=2631580 RepID=UPI00263A78D2|nr:nucleotidyltransferase domain-containing protein [Bradyrhizobium sp. WYCCWR 13022]MDN4982293.1 nucleotidyltransferase domain-containing protein [Bradyrhizobium sp. WYCCWR 13022]
MIERHLVEALSKWAAQKPAIVAVWLFGSRARGDHRPDSDYDIALELAARRGKNDWAFTEYFFDGDTWKVEIRNLLQSDLSLVCFREDLDCKFDPRVLMIWRR